MTQPSDQTSTNLLARARDPLGGIVELWENAEENQPLLIGCLIISLTHSL